MVDYNKNSEWIGSVSMVTQLGLTMSGSVLACLLLGRWISDLLGHSGIFIPVFILFGVFGGANVCYRQIISAMVSNSKRN